MNANLQLKIDKIYFLEILKKKEERGKKDMKTQRLLSFVR